MKLNVHVELYAKIQEYTLSLDTEDDNVSLQEDKVQGQLVERLRDELLARHYYNGCGCSKDIVRAADDKIEIEYNFCGQKVNEIKKEDVVVGYAPQLRAEKLVKTIISKPTET